METSLFLAKVLGSFGAISTLLIILNYKKHLLMEEEVVKNLSSVYSSGFLFLLIGVLIVISHQVWEPDWRVIITILGWMILLKGIMRILFPEKVIYLIAKKKNNKRFLLAEIVTLLICVFLFYQGFIEN